MSKLTESFRAVGVYNPYEFYGAQPYISYRSDVGGRGQFWGVSKRGLDLGSAWYDHGQKSFSLFIPGESFKERKATALAQAQEWASERFGVSEWARDPYGCYGPADFVKTRTAELKRAAKELS